MLNLLSINQLIMAEGRLLQGGCIETLIRDRHLLELHARHFLLVSHGTTDVFFDGIPTDSDAIHVLFKFERLPAVIYRPPLKAPKEALPEQQ